MLLYSVACEDHIVMGSSEYLTPKDTPSFLKQSNFIDLSSKLSSQGHNTDSAAYTSRGFFCVSSFKLPKPKKQVGVRITRSNLPKDSVSSKITKEGMVAGGYLK